MSHHPSEEHRELHEHLRRVCDHLTYEVREITKIKSIANNSAVVGAYAEALVRRLIRRSVAPLRVATGAVLKFPTTEDIAQEDVIIWAPNPATALCDVDDFAVVPESSVFGVVEIKKSDYTGAIPGIANFHDRWPCASAPWNSTGGLNVHTGEIPALSIICHALTFNEKTSLSEYRSSGRTALLFSFDEDGEYEANADDVIRLVNFLHVVTIRYHLILAQSPQLMVPLPG